MVTTRLLLAGTTTAIKCSRSSGIIQVETISSSLVAAIRESTPVEEDTINDMEEDMVAVIMDRDMGAIVEIMAVKVTEVVEEAVMARAMERGMEEAIEGIVICRGMGIEAERTGTM